MNGKSNKVVALIPARGGSKGIPRKNIIKIAGKPLISYSIEAAKNTPSIDEVWVSSDDKEILEISKSYGALSIERPIEISDDNASSEEALIHFTKYVNYDTLVFLQATSPLIQKEDLMGGIKLMDRYDSVVSVTGLTQFVWDEQGPHYDLNNRKRRQDLGQKFLENGAFFITTKEGLLTSRNRLNGSIGKLVMPKLRSLDIDTYDDLEIVEKVISIVDKK